MNIPNNKTPITEHSLTFLEDIRIMELKDELDFYNKDYRGFLGLCPMGSDEYISLKYKMTMHQYLTREFDVKAYYVSLAKYRNNKRVV